MNLPDIAVKNEEKAVFALRALYRRYGYLPYKMTKFEEYDLYGRNKDFLVSDHVITFTDTNGKLMALKPDVTLSIIKSGKDEPNTVQKVYYDENVYRVASGARTFQEIMQAGLECIGSIDDYCISEVLLLAAKSISTISPDCALNISHLGIVSAVLNLCGLSEIARPQIFRCIGEKNPHELAAICREAAVSETRISALTALTATYGRPDEVLPKLPALLGDLADNDSLRQLDDITRALAASDVRDSIRIDFSVVNDVNYYNGLVFKGFINGIPAGVLSGGQYDRLMRRMQRKSGAIGFAVYLNLLDRLHAPDSRFDVDTVLLYEKGTEVAGVQRAVKSLTGGGVSVTAVRAVPEKLRYRRLLQYTEEGVRTVVEHA